MFKGNENGDSIHKNEFEVPIIAQWIRINPTRWRDRISMRVELFGCDYGNKIKIKLLVTHCNLHFFFFQSLINYTSMEVL